MAPPPLIHAGSLALLLLNRVSSEPVLPTRASRLLGWPLMIGGILLARSFFLGFKRAGTPMNPGSPVTSIVTDAPYRYTRNPAYLAFAAIYAGVAVLRNALPAILLLPPTLLAIQRGVIEREERYLARKFGEE